MSVEEIKMKGNRIMTNLEMVLKNDGERFIKEISEKICFCAYEHKVKPIQPPLCGDCSFGEVFSNGRCKCHTDEVVEWLKAEVEE